MNTKEPLYNFAKSPGADVFYDPGFRAEIETHLPLLRNYSKTTVQNIEPSVAYKNENDFVGLLNDIGMSNDMHWITMRLNSMTKPQDYRSNMLSILIPPSDYIDLIRKKYSTVHRIK